MVVLPLYTFCNHILFTNLLPQGSTNNIPLLSTSASSSTHIVEVIINRIYHYLTVWQRLGGGVQVTSTLPSLGEWIKHVLLLLFWQEVMSQRVKSIMSSHVSHIHGSIL